LYALLVTPAASAIVVNAAELCAGAVAELDPAGWTTSGGSAGAAGAVAVFATALGVPRAVLTVALAARRVSRCLADAKRSQRAPDDGSAHQPERFAPRDGAIGQSSGQIVEEAIFSCHWQPPPTMTGLVSPAELRNVG